MSYYVKSGMGAVAAAGKGPSLTPVGIYVHLFQLSGVWMMMSTHGICWTTSGHTQCGMTGTDGAPLGATGDLQAAIAYALSAVAAPTALKYMQTTGIVYEGQLMGIYRPSLPVAHGAHGFGRGLGLIPPYDEISHFRAPYKNAVFGQAPSCPPGQIADADHDFQCVPDPAAKASLGTTALVVLGVGAVAALALLL